MFVHRLSHQTIGIRPQHDGNLSGIQVLLQDALIHSTLDEADDETPDSPVACRAQLHHLVRHLLVHLGILEEIEHAEVVSVMFEKVIVGFSEIGYAFDGWLV